MGAVPSRESHEDPSSTFFANCGNLVVLHIPLTRHFFPSHRCLAFRQLREARNNQSALYSFDVRSLAEWLPGAPAEAFRTAQQRDHGEEVAEEDPCIHYFDHEIEKAQEGEIAAQARARLAEGSSDQNADNDREEDGDEPDEVDETATQRQWREVEKKATQQGIGSTSRPPRCSIESLKYLYTYLVVDAAAAPDSTAGVAETSHRLAHNDDAASRGNEENNALEDRFEREEAAWVRSPWRVHGIRLDETNQALCERVAAEAAWRGALDAWQQQHQQEQEERQSAGRASGKSCENISPLSPPPRPPQNAFFPCPIPEALAVRLTPHEVQAARRQNKTLQQHNNSNNSGQDREMASAVHPSSSTATMPSRLTEEEEEEAARLAEAKARWPVPLPSGHLLRRRFDFESEARYKDGRLHLVEEDGVLYYFAMNPHFSEPDLESENGGGGEVASQCPDLRQFLVEPCPHTVIRYARSHRSGDSQSQNNNSNNGKQIASRDGDDGDSDAGAERDAEDEEEGKGANASSGPAQRRVLGECEQCGLMVGRRLDGTRSAIPTFPSASEAKDRWSGVGGASRDGATSALHDDDDDHAMANGAIDFDRAGLPSGACQSVYAARYLVPVTPIRVVGVHGAVPARSRGSPWLRGFDSASSDVDLYLEKHLDLHQRPPVLRLCRFIEGAIGEKILNRATLVSLLTYRGLCQRAGLADALVRPVWVSCTMSNIPFLQMVRETFFRARAAVAEIDDNDRTLREWIEQFDAENNFLCFINRNLSTARDYDPPERQLRGSASPAVHAHGSSPTSATACAPSRTSLACNTVTATDVSAAGGTQCGREGEAVVSSAALSSRRSENDNLAMHSGGGSAHALGVTGEEQNGGEIDSAPRHATVSHALRRSGENLLDGEVVVGEKGAIGRPEGHIPRDAEENGEDVYNEDDLSKLVVPPEKPNFSLFSSRLEPHAPVSIYTLFEHDIQQDEALPPEALPGYVQRDLLIANQRRQEEPIHTRRPSHALYEAGMRQSTRGRQLLFQIRADCLFALMYYCSQAAAPIFIGAYIEPVDTTPLSYGGAVRLVDPKPTALSQDETHRMLIATGSRAGAPPAASSSVPSQPHSPSPPPPCDGTSPFAQMAPLDPQISLMVEEYFLEKELITVFSVSDSTTWARGPDAAHSLHKLLLPAPPNPESELAQTQAKERELFGHVYSYAPGDFRDADLVVYNSTLRCWEHYEHVQIRRRFNWTSQQQQQQLPSASSDRGVDDDAKEDEHDEEIEEGNAEASTTSALHSPPCEARPTTLTQRQQRAIEAAGISAGAPQDPASMSARLLCVGLDELLLSWTKWVVDNRFYEDRADPGWLRLNLNAPWPPHPVNGEQEDHAGAVVSVHALVRRGRYFIWSFRHNEERYFYGVIPKFAKDRLRRQKTHYRQRKKRAAAAAAAAVGAKTSTGLKSSTDDTGTFEEGLRPSGEGARRSAAKAQLPSNSSRPNDDSEYDGEEDVEDELVQIIKRIPKGAAPSREGKQKKTDAKRRGDAERTASTNRTATTATTKVAPTSSEASPPPRGRRASSGSTAKAGRTPARSQSWHVTELPAPLESSHAEAAAEEAGLVRSEHSNNGAQTRPPPPLPPPDYPGDAAVLPHHVDPSHASLASSSASTQARDRRRPAPLEYSASVGGVTSPAHGYSHPMQTTSLVSPSSGSPLMSAAAMSASSAPASSTQPWCQSMPAPCVPSQPQEPQPYPQMGSSLTHAPPHLQQPASQPPRGMSPMISTPTAPHGVLSGSPLMGSHRLLSSSFGHGAAYASLAPPTPTHGPFSGQNSLPPQHQQASLAYHRNGVNTFMQANKRHENEYYPPLPTNPQQRLFGRPTVPSTSPSMSTTTRPLTGVNARLTASSLPLPPSATSSPPDSGRSTPHVQIRVRALKSTQVNASGGVGPTGSHPSTPVGSFVSSSFVSGSPSGAHAVAAYGCASFSGSLLSEPMAFSPTSAQQQQQAHGRSPFAGPSLGYIGSVGSAGARYGSLHAPATLTTAASGTLKHNVGEEEEEEDGRVSPTSLLPPNLIQDGSKTKGESYLRTEEDPERKEMRSAFRWNPYSRKKPE